MTILKLCLCFHSLYGSSCISSHKNIPDSINMLLNMLPLLPLHVGCKQSCIFSSEKWPGKFGVKQSNEFQKLRFPNEATLQPTPYFSDSCSSRILGFSDRCGLKFSSFMESVTAAELFAPLYQEEVIRNTTLNKAISRDTARVTGC